MLMLSMSTSGSTCQCKILNGERFAWGACTARHTGLAVGFILPDGSLQRSSSCGDGTPLLVTTRRDARR